MRNPGAVKVFLSEGERQLVEQAASREERSLSQVLRRAALRTLEAERDRQDERTAA
jgi:hypothetical protein